VFHKNRNTAIGIKTGRQLLVFHDMENAAPTYSFLKDYITEKDIEKLTERPVRNLIDINNLRLLKIDSSAIYQIPDLSPDVLLLSNSPRINLERLIKELQPGLIIADGSNYPSAIKRWKATAEKEKLPFHATGEKGAFVFTPPEEGN
ncbi:MAG TPA: hypothetical protein VK941_07925, partial [Gillisia sp.]|nr:hypothetical protein [Gillisia sp.]